MSAHARLPHAATTCSDAELVAATRRQSTDAFGLLYARYESSSRKIARRAGVHSVDIDDVVADAWTRVLRAIQGGRGPTDNFAGYLATSIRRVAWAYGARRSTLIPTDDATLLDGVWEDWRPASLTDTPLARAIALLPTSWAEVIWRIEVDGEPVSAIAKELGKSPNSVSAIASRARKRLRTHLADERGWTDPRAVGRGVA